MVPRYRTPEMSALWSIENKYRMWLSVELAVCRAWNELGMISRDALSVILEKASFTASRIEELEHETRHDVAAFLQNVQEQVGPEGRFIHLGVTSSDILDTAQALIMGESLDLIEKRIEALGEVLRDMAVAHKTTPAAGRTHGVHAEPMSFGLKFLLWYDEMLRHREHLKEVRREVKTGKISGAVGTYATVEPAVERSVCRQLGLEPAPISTQIVQRERHARYVALLALLGATIEKIATELRHLQRTEVMEAMEGFGKGQKGSSAMPHKRNPVSAENLCGLSRVLRGHVVTAYEDVALWHERDISHSSAERIILPDSSQLADYMLARLTALMAGLSIDQGRMRENLELTRGLVFSQRVLLALIDKGMERDSAYRVIQEAAGRVWEDKSLSLFDELKSCGEVGRHLAESELEALFDYSWYLRHVDEIYRRFGL
ncbi:MAG: adenylosuccinate lyase [Candidatus Eremiobacteraeota bacterium]|nr:adenylosuccinate lyase [Candidatus Eremiobacteraeota bacterium]